MNICSKIQELIDEGQYTEERRKFSNREPLPNFFDCLDGRDDDRTATPTDKTEGSGVETIVSGIEKKGR